MSFFEAILSDDSTLKQAFGEAVYSGLIETPVFAATVVGGTASMIFPITLLLAGPTVMVAALSAFAGGLVFAQANTTYIRPYLERKGVLYGPGYPIHNPDG